MELAEVNLADDGGSREAEPAKARRGSSADSLEEEEAEEGVRRASRASSLVSGLLTELYSAGRWSWHRSSVDSSTEASAGSDAFPGGRHESRALQELQRRPGPRHQRQYLARKDLSELTTIIRELNYTICVQSSKLLRLLKQKDRLLHKVQKNCDIVTACLQAVSQKRRKYCLVLLIQEC
nr:PREDICTED: TBC1 domain family member 30 [Anolis carolinensis]|eukprot:XP_016849294.1 PREDICTED: TBC1 domain family member 30 [Anolis carolinensis]